MRECLDSWREVLFRHLDEEVSDPDISSLMGLFQFPNHYKGCRFIWREYEEVLDSGGIERDSYVMIIVQYPCYLYLIVA